MCQPLAVMVGCAWAPAAGNSARHKRPANALASSPKPQQPQFGVQGNQPFNQFSITIDQGDLEEYEIMQIVLEAQDYTSARSGKRGHF